MINKIQVLKLTILSLFLLPSTSIFASTTETVVVDLSANSMVASVQVAVENDRLTVLHNEAGSSICDVSEKLSTTASRNIADLVSNLPTGELASLERPACNACSDADYDASLTVTINGVRYESSGFDLHEPSETLLPLVHTLAVSAEELCPGLFRPKLLDREINWQSDKTTESSEETSTVDKEIVTSDKEVSVPDNETPITGNDVSPADQETTVLVRIIELLQRIVKLLSF